MSDPGFLASEGHFTTVPVNPDGTWSYSWQTSSAGFTTGGAYTVYAVTEPLDRSHLSQGVYDSTSFGLKLPFLSALMEKSEVCRGSNITISGSAEGDPPAIGLWILSWNYFKHLIIPITEEGTYRVDIPIDVKQYPGQYIVYLQHPSINREFDIVEVKDFPAQGQTSIQVKGSTESFIIEGKGSLDKSVGATQLVEMFDSKTHDDVFTKLQFLVTCTPVQGPSTLSINPVDSKYVGDKFTISGTTTLPADEVLHVDVFSASFLPKEWSRDKPMISGMTSVQRGFPTNTWSFDVDTLDLAPDIIIIHVQSDDIRAEAIRDFELLDASVETVTTTPLPSKGNQALASLPLPVDGTFTVLIVVIVSSMFLLGLRFWLQKEKSGRSEGDSSGVVRRTESSSSGFPTISESNRTATSTTISRSPPAIPHDIFISHSQHDKVIAETILKSLESRGIRCWIAPRDITPGQNFPEAIVSAIDDSTLMLLIFSSHSNSSTHVERELTHAVSKGVTIIPFRIEDVPLSKAMEYLIGMPQWFDAISPPLERHIDVLTTTIQSILREKNT